MMAKRPADRSGVCICGAAVADHFTKSGRKRSCEDVLRLAMINRGATVSRQTVDVDEMGKPDRQVATLRLVKSDRRKII